MNMTKTNQQRAILRIGEHWPAEGGVLAGFVRGEAGKPDYYLILPTDDKTQHTGLQWGGYEWGENGATHEFDGAANTVALVTSNLDHPAAQFCAGLTTGGFKDWYLPARRELRTLWCTVPGLINDRWYWSSTQCSPYDAWCQDFGNGTQYSGIKGDDFRVLAVRRYLVI